MTNATPAASAVSSGRAKFSLAVLILGMAMAMLDVSIVNVALPSIRTSLNADEATLSWIISGYSLAAGLALIPSGWLGDRVGHKPVYIVGIVIFTLASLWCGLSTDSTQLVVARVLQGLGGGIFSPAVAALIQLLFSGRARGVAFAIMGATMGIFTALGPLVGGLIIQWLGDTDGWRYIFFVNLPIGVFAFIAALIALPGGAEARNKRGLDGVGLILLAVGLAALLVPLIEGQTLDWPLWTWVSLGAGVLLLVLFALWQVALAKRDGAPLVPPHLFSHAAFTGGTLLAFVYFAAFTSIFFSISIFWQAGLGHTALESGLVSIPFSVGSIVGAALSERLSHRLGRTVLIIGTACVAAGLIAAWLVVWLVDPTTITAWDLLLPLLIAGFGNGLFIAPNVQFIVATVDRAEAGAASGVVNTLQRIGAAIGIAVIGTVLFGAIDDGALAQAGQQTAQQHDPSIIAAALAQQFQHGAALALMTSAIFAVVAFLLVWALPKRVAERGAAPAAAEVAGH